MLGVMEEMNEQVKFVTNFKDLVETNFHGKNNAICWQRSFDYDFDEILTKLTLHEDITEISIEDLFQLKLTNSGVKAREVIINDMKLLGDFGAQPSLNLIKCYDRDDEFSFISTDVYSFHVDRSPILMDTYLCTYSGASSDIIPNNEALKKIEIPEIRKQLHELYEGPDEEFNDFLTENFFDLHYHVENINKAYNLGNINLWRLAVDHPEQPVLPCVHRAPREGNELRLMLIC